jgi:hypothetical protein
MKATDRALHLINDNQIESPTEFARLMWPNSDGWRRVGNVGHGAHAGAGMQLAGGSFLGRLRAKGLIVGGYTRDRITLTDKGRERLQKR